jgi:alpha-ribazole phosphatase
MGTTRLILVRHAEPAAADGVCYGGLDLELSDRGREQAAEAAAALAGTEVAAVYSSPARRATDTALPIAAAHGVTPITDARLTEIDFGEFEGRRFDDIEAAYPEIYETWMRTPTKVRFPGGESWQDLLARSTAAASAIVEAHRDETVVVVSHGGVNRAILSAVLGTLGDAVFRIGQGYACISIVDYFDGAPVVTLLNSPPSGDFRISG